MRVTAIAAVVAANVVLAATLAYLWTEGGGTRWTDPEAVPPAIEEVAAPPVSEAADVSPYRQTLERPLFAANRRPAPRKDAEEAQAAADALKDVHLLGTYEAGGRGGIVIAIGGKAQRVAFGESIGGWKVAGAGQGRSAELVSADGRRRQLELALNNAAPAMPAAAGKEGAAEAGQAAAADRAPSAGAAAPATSQRGAAARGRSGRGGRETGSEARQQRLDRINQQRAARGQPPRSETR